MPTDPQGPLFTDSATVAVIADSSVTWDIGPGNSQTAVSSNFVFADSTNYYAHGSGIGGTIDFMVGSESPSRFRKLKWKLWDISHSIRCLGSRLGNFHHERQRIKAEAKARTLLDDLFVLVPGQKVIVVPSELHRNRVYRIPIDGSMPEVWINEVLDHRLCLQKSSKHKEFIPVTDLVITRALMAMGAESDLLRVANKIGASVFSGPGLVFHQQQDPDM